MRQFQVSICCGEARASWPGDVAGDDALAVIAELGLLLGKDANAPLRGVCYCREGCSAVSVGLLS
jgi:hypothetical protein